ncbi:MAG: DNA polymerase/3'-5' exonuclease PolX [Bacillota bacterium]
MLQNFEIAWAFRELADLLEFKEEDFFKVRAYRRAAKTIAGLNEPVELLYRRGDLAGVPGIGKNILAKIGEMVATGKMRKLEELRAEIPPGVLEIMDLPGIGPKRAALLYKHLKVASLNDLEEEARQARVRAVPGLGAKTEQDILRNIEMLRSRSGRVLLGFARELAQELGEFLKNLPGVKRIEPTGSVRRWRETVGDIDLLAMTDAPERLFASFAGHPQVKEILVREEDRMKVITWWGVVVELLAAPEEAYWSTLLWSTGNQEHYRQLQLLAQQKGLELSRGGIRRQDGKFFLIKGEEDIYRHLGLPFIPPDLRENRGEIEFCLKTGRLPEVVRLRDIKGDLHIHTNWSDGVNSLEQIIDYARKKGYRYIAITDHSPSLKIARGLSLEQLKEQRKLIEKMNEKYDDIRIFSGLEVDILPQGGLDCPPEILAQLDVVIASVHTSFRQDRRTMTERILSAVRNEYVDIIGHLTGRLIGQREAYLVDVEKILAAARDYGKFMEINSSPDRLDLSEEHARLAKEYGLKMVINTDAHDLRRMDEMPYGVAVARRAWLQPADVLNTLKIDEVTKLFRKKMTYGE